jgi:hypothetical protein
MIFWFLVLFIVGRSIISFIQRLLTVQHLPQSREAKMAELCAIYKQQYKDVSCF